MEGSPKACPLWVALEANDLRKAWRGAVFHVQLLIGCLFQEYFNRVLGIHDTCGVHYTFGLPGLLGGIAYILLIIYDVNWTQKSM